MEPRSRSHRRRGDGRPPSRTPGDDALRAAPAAAELDDALGDLNAELEASVDLRIRIRVGINTGEVMVTSGSEGRWRQAIP